MQEKAEYDCFMEMAEIYLEFSQKILDLKEKYKNRPKEVERINEFIKGAWETKNLPYFGEVQNIH